MQRRNTLFLVLVLALVCVLCAPAWGRSKKRGVRAKRGHSSRVAQARLKRSPVRRRMHRVHRRVRRSSRRGLARRRGRASCHRLLRREYAMRYVRSARRLEASIQSYLHDLRKCRLLESFDRPRVLVYDFRNCKVVSVNQHLRTSAASLIKPFVMLAVYHRAYRRGLRSPRQFPSRIQQYINRMMRVSSNRATNFLIRQYLGNGSTQRGLRYINKVMPGYGIRHTRLLELIPAGGRTYRNYTTARDLSILLYKIYHRQAVSPQYSRRMLQVMLQSRDNRGRTSYLRANFDMRAATKTGYTRRTNGVAGIVLAGAGLRRHAYNYVAIISRPLVRANEYRWRKTSSQILRRISEMTYRHYARGYEEKGVRRFGGRRPKGYCRR